MSFLSASNLRWWRLMRLIKLSKNSDIFFCSSISGIGIINSETLFANKFGCAAALCKDSLWHIINAASLELSNSVLEKCNSKAKFIKQISYGFRDMKYYFLKLFQAFQGKTPLREWYEYCYSDVLLFNKNLWRTN